jgi:adenine deaminase
MTAIQMMTINTAEHFGVNREMGMIAPGRWADVVLATDLKNFKADVVIAKGNVLAESGEWKVNLPKATYPAWAKNSVRLKRRLKAQDFKLQVKTEKSKVKANVIGVIENHVGTRHLTFDLQPENGEIKANLARDLAKVALVERHKGTGAITIGLVSGFGFTSKCAIASTVAHDSHHMIVVGTDDESMAVAGNTLARTGGGQVVVRGGEVVGLVELKIAGLMSAERTEIVAHKAESILNGFKMCGCELNNPNMQLAFLALVVIPELRISDKGLVDVTQFKFIPVLEG